MQLLSSKWLSNGRAATIVLIAVFITALAFRNPVWDQAFLYAMGLWFGNLAIIQAKKPSDSEKGK